MDFEGKIRTRIEAILINDAKNSVELEQMAPVDEPLQRDLFEEERNLYQRIINNYRSALAEVNNLMEETVGFLSAIYRVVDSVKEKQDLEEIATQVVDCVLQDLHPEYCGLMFFQDEAGIQESLCLEGVKEDQKFIRVHTGACLLENADFDRVIHDLLEETHGAINIPDLYRDPRFNTVDLPGVVRSLLLFPLTLSNRMTGVLVLGHSQPHFFRNGHLRVLEILSGYLAHLVLLNSKTRRPEMSRTLELPPGEESTIFSVVLMNFESLGPGKSKETLGRVDLQEIRKALRSSLREGESLIAHGSRDLLALLPGVRDTSLPERIRLFREGFELWRSSRGESKRGIRMRTGSAACREGEDLARTLQVASLLMKPADVEFAVPTPEPPGLR